MFQVRTSAILLPSGYQLRPTFAAVGDVDRLRCVILKARAVSSSYHAEVCRYPKIVAQILNPQSVFDMSHVAGLPCFRPFQEPLLRPFQTQKHRRTLATPPQYFPPAPNVTARDPHAWRPRESRASKTVRKGCPATAWGCLNLEVSGRDKFMIWFSR